MSSANDAMFGVWCIGCFLLATIYVALLQSDAVIELELYLASVENNVERLDKLYIKHRHRITDQMITTAFTKAALGGHFAATLWLLRHGVTKEQAQETLRWLKVGGEMSNKKIIDLLGEVQKSALLA